MFSIRLTTFLALLLANFVTPGFAATPGPMPKPGIYKSKCGELTVLRMIKKESKFTFKLEATDGNMNSGTIEKASAFQACSDECTWIFQYDEFPDCRFWININGDVIELSGNEDMAACGFGNRVYGNGKYHRAK